MMSHPPPQIVKMRKMTKMMRWGYSPTLEVRIKTSGVFIPTGANNRFLEFNLSLPSGMIRTGSCLVGMKACSYTGPLQIRLMTPAVKINDPVD